jgi:hypothetical protein
MAKAKLTKEERLVQEQMLALLEYATEPPHMRARLHDIGSLKASQEAAKRLQARGVIEMDERRQKYRLKGG